MDRQESFDVTCPVCHERKEIIAVGSCDHPICHRCSTRLRVVCETDECPICRTEQAKVLFLSLSSSGKFADIDSSKYIFNHRSKVYFENSDVEAAYRKLVDHVCPECKERFQDRNFRGFKEHMRKKHSLFFCDICVSALKIFTHERKLYNREQLATHRRKGDPDDSSYKGHPLCRFCDERYLDNEELFKHLRKEHYYCHFCEESGSNEYYSDYPELRDHFRTHHFICEEGECAGAQFTHAFRSKIDYQAHMALAHADKSMSKSQSRQARALDVEFPLAPRNRERDRGVINHEDYEDVRSAGRGSDNVRRGYGPGRGRDSRGGRGGRYRDRDLDRALQASLNVMKEQEKPSPVEEPEPEPEVKSPVITHDLDNFPSLGAHSTQEKKVETTDSGSSYGLAKKLALSSHHTVRHGTLNDEAFPSLGPAASDLIPPKAASKPEKNDQTVNTYKNTYKHSNDSSNSQKPQMPVSSVYKKPKNTEEEFPELSRKSNPNKGGSETPNPVWITKGKKTTSVPNYPASKSSSSLSKSSDNDIIKGVQTKNISLPPSMSVVSSPSYSCDDKDFPTLGSRPSVNQGAQWITKPAKSNGNSNVVNLQHPAHSKKQSAKTPAVPAPYISNSSKSKNSQSGHSNINSEKKSKKIKNKSPHSDGGHKIDKENNRSISLSNIAGSMLKGDSYAGEQTRSTSADKVIREQNGQEQTCPVEAESNIKLVSQEAIVEMKKSKDQNNKTATKPKLTEDDFPTLGHEESSAPPGFSSKSKAPPGFSNALKLEATVILDDIEFPENSVEIEKPVFMYSQPNNFSDRNRQLVHNVNDLLNNDETKFGMFKSISGEFRKDIISASEYFDKCNELLGHEQFSTLFPELLALLPDIEKQNEMLSVCEKKSKDMLSNASSKKKSVWSNKEKLFSSCPTCDQVLLKTDFNDHILLHGTFVDDFPTLPCATGKPQYGLKPFNITAN